MGGLSGLGDPSCCANLAELVTPFKSSKQLKLFNGFYAQLEKKLPAVPPSKISREYLRYVKNLYKVCGAF